MIRAARWIAMAIAVAAIVDPRLPLPHSQRPVVRVVSEAPRDTTRVVDALKEAGFFVRTVILNGAPSFWVSDPIAESGSFSGSFARRLVRFLRARL